MKPRKQSFGEKYNVTGKPIGISKRTREIIAALDRECRYVIEAGEDYVKTETRLFGE